MKPFNKFVIRALSSLKTHGYAECFKPRDHDLLFKLETRVANLLNGFKNFNVHVSMIPTLTFRIWVISVKKIRHKTAVSISDINKPLNINFRHEDIKTLEIKHKN